ncbi:MAG TPA: decaprenyl-phosphate phosphoribosyltransferase, partial [Deltaproteobacteria bacterium]|nr:decaprenyl-phosphate phosphoribosyltransferase [Deltaproteobacteria bacterium]
MTQPLAPPTPLSIVSAAVKQLRPKQWLKNVFMLPAVIFSGKFLEIEPVLAT